MEIAFSPVLKQGQDAHLFRYHIITIDGERYRISLRNRKRESLSSTKEGFEKAYQEWKKVIRAKKISFDPIHTKQATMNTDGDISIQAFNGETTTCQIKKIVNLFHSVIARKSQPGDIRPKRAVVNPPSNIHLNEIHESQEASSLVGLYRSANTCWANSLLQCVFFRSGEMIAFIKWMARHNNQHQNAFKILDKVLKIYIAAALKGEISTGEKTESLIGQFFNAFGFNIANVYDMEEVMKEIMKIYDTYCKRTERTNAFKFVEHHANRNGTSQEEEHVLRLGVQNTQRTTLQKLIDNQINFSARTLSDAPKHLSIFLQRRTEDQRAEMIHTPVIVSSRLTLQSKHLMQNENNQHHYSLQAFAVNTGMHYISYVLKNGQWHELDDHHTRQITHSEALQKAKRCAMVFYEKSASKIKRRRDLPLHILNNQDYTASSEDEACV